MHVHNTEIHIVPSQVCTVPGRSPEASEDFLVQYNHLARSICRNAGKWHEQFNTLGFPEGLEYNLHATYLPQPLCLVKLHKEQFEAVLYHQLSMCKKQIVATLYCITEDPYHNILYNSLEHVIHTLNDHNRMIVFDAEDIRKVLINGISPIATLPVATNPTATNKR